MVTNALGIAAVTAVLKDRLNDAVINANVVANVLISALPPERLSQAGADPGNRLNMFLYRVERNQGWINECLPERRSSGGKVNNSYLALDLHYLLSAYGDSDLEAEVLLGYGMQMLQESPVLDRDSIRTSLGTNIVPGQLLPDAFENLSAADVADQIEQITITHFTHSVEDEWRLWSALSAGLRPSATYKASVVLIETRGHTSSALPVAQTRFNVGQIRRPRITRLRSRAAADDPLSEQRRVQRGDSLVIDGSGLAGDETFVRIGGIDLEVADPDDAEVTVELPATVLPGLKTLQVVHRIGRPLANAVPEIDPAPAGSTESITSELSNAVVAPISVGFVAAPFTVTATNSVVTDQGTFVDVELEVAVDGPVGVDQQTSVLLNELDPPPDRPAHAVVGDAARPDGPATQTETLNFVLRAVPAASYLLRIQVDGVASELTMADGRYSEPQIVVAP